MITGKLLDLVDVEKGEIFEVCSEEEVEVVFVVFPVVVASVVVASVAVVVCTAGKTVPVIVACVAGRAPCTESHI